MKVTSIELNSTSYSGIMGMVQYQSLDRKQTVSIQLNEEQVRKLFEQVRWYLPYPDSVETELQEFPQAENVSSTVVSTTNDFMSDVPDA